MKTKNQHALIIFGIIFSIIPIIFYLTAIISAEPMDFFIGIVIQAIGGAMISVAKREHAKTKEKDRLDLERLVRENNQHEQDKNLV